MLLVFNWAKQILKIARDFEPALGEPRRARRASVSLPFRASRAKLNARAGKKEGGWGEGIFARPRFPPPPNFVSAFGGCAARVDVALDPPNPFAGNAKELPKIFL
jgi:hypothetical protein